MIAVACILSVGGGCGFFATGLTDVMIESKENGYLLALPGSGGANAEVLVVHRSWVIVTILDPAYDVVPIDRFSSPYVDSVEVSRFPSATQVSFRFRHKIERASLVADRENNSILIPVFTR